MTDLVTAALEVQQLCEEMNWQFCFIGGLALQVLGQPRLTNDIDLTLFTEFVNDESSVEALLSRFEGRLSDAKEFALSKRVLLLKTEGGIGIDVSLGALPYEHGLVKRASYRKFTPEISLKTCSPEDLIVLKAVASRAQDWADIESVVIKQAELDWDYVDEQLVPFIELLDSPQTLERLRQLRSTYYQK